MPRQGRTSPSIRCSRSYEKWVFRRNSRNASLKSGLGTIESRRLKRRLRDRFWVFRFAGVSLRIVVPHHPFLDHLISRAEGLGFPSGELIETYSFHIIADPKKHN